MVSRYRSLALYSLAIVIAGLPIARTGLATLRATHRLDINVLMTIAVIGAAAIGEWLEAAREMDRAIPEPKGRLLFA